MPNQNQIVIGVVVTIFVFLMAGFFIFALVAFYNRRKKSFVKEKERLREIFNQQLLQSQLEMQEQTFNIISQEIHDNVGQVLSLAKVQVNILDQSESIDRSMLTDVKESISKAMADLRDIAKSLNSERIKLCTLVEMTNHELQRIDRLQILKTFLQVHGNERDVQEQKKVFVLRIIQESLQNIMKHSKANTVKVYFTFTNEYFELQIIDDGIGFDQQLINHKDGLGLQNIINRAALIGGKASIESTLTKGTKVIIISPYV